MKAIPIESPLICYPSIYRERYEIEFPEKTKTTNRFIEELDWHSCEKISTAEDELKKVLHSLPP